MHHHGHHGHHGHAHNHAHNIALMHHQHHSDMHHSAHHAAHHRGGHRRAHRFGDDDNVVVYLPPPSGTVLTVTFTTEIPGFPRLNSLPSSMEVESGGGGYAALLESSNRLIQQLNHAVEENYATPMRLRRICLCISILCFLGFGISGFMAVSTFGAPAAVGGVVACFLGFAIFGIFIPVGISKYYSTRYLTSIQDCLDQTNRSLRGFHW